MQRRVGQQVVALSQVFLRGFKPLERGSRLEGLLLPLRPRRLVAEPDGSLPERRSDSVFFLLDRLLFFCRLGWIVMLGLA